MATKGVPSAAGAELLARKPAYAFPNIFAADAWMDEAEQMLRRLTAAPAEAMGADDAALCASLRRGGATLGECRDAAARIESLSAQNSALLARAELWQARAENLSRMSDGESAAKYWAKVDALRATPEALAADSAKGAGS